MKKNIFLLFSFVSLGFCSDAIFPGVPRDSNYNNTSSYGNTSVEARLIMHVKESTKVVHFIRDNNDPRVVTKAYLLKNVDAYEFRDFVRQMVQAKRVGNTSLQQLYPSNTTNPNVATTSSVGVTTPVSAQPTYSPAFQLGSNTAVECIKYADGTGILIISAEEYRFYDNKNGMGFDSLVKFLDKPQMGANFGTQTFFYVPKFVPARNLQPLIENVGMNISDVTEAWQGSDLVAYDSDLNWLIFDVTNFSMPNIEKMLKLYDVPIPQVRLRIKVYEIYKEDDQKLGMDFQAWKNNDGLDLFSAGGRFRDNWSAAFAGSLSQTGYGKTSFYNFNPKWNTRYIDLLTSKGDAKILYTGELCIRNNTPATLDRTTQIFYIDTTTTSADATNPAVQENISKLVAKQIDPDTAVLFKDDTNQINIDAIAPDEGVGPYELLSSILDVVIPTDEDYPVAKANLEQVEKFAGFGFSMKVNNASVNLKETRFSVNLSNSSLIGFESTGAPRISQNSTVNLEISLPHNNNQFVIGGLKKVESIKSISGVPWLMDIPYVKYLFSTETTTLKHSELVVVGECIFDAPTDKPQQPARTKPFKL